MNESTYRILLNGNILFYIIPNYNAFQKTVCWIFKKTFDDVTDRRKLRL
jgi:hypothetical protein